MLDAYRAAARLVPEDDQIAWMAGSRLLASGLVDEAAPLVRRAVTAMPAWPEHTRRMAAAGHLSREAAEQLAGLVEAER